MAVCSKRRKNSLLLNRRLTNRPSEGVDSPEATPVSATGRRKWLSESASVRSTEVVYATGKSARVCPTEAPNKIGKMMEVPATDARKPNCESGC